MLPVAVEIAPPEAPREEVLVLLAACSRAVADSECELAADVGDGPTRAVAIVTWQSDSRVFVEVGMRRDGRSEWRSRSVLFVASDDPSERWKAVGFAVGTLARGDSTEPAQPTRTAPPPVGSQKPPPTAAAKPKPKSQSAPPPRVQAKAGATKPAPEQEDDSDHESVAIPRVRLQGGALDLGAAIGPGLDGIRYGGVVRLQLPLFAGFQLIGGGAYLRYRNVPLHLSSSWLDLRAGVARSVRGEFWEFQLGADVRAEYLSVEVRDATRSDHRARWQPGFGLFTSVTWLPIERLGLFVSGGAAVFTRKTNLQIAETPVAVDEPVQFVVDAGLRLRLW